ncbi:hypothetical protein Pelo_5392 [Pelomyxa schiedti]|nr:hypothetical protein Pelo_5392 [Pelomyxa schiedti]
MVSKSTFLIGVGLVIGTITVYLLLVNTTDKASVQVDVENEGTEKEVKPPPEVLHSDAKSTSVPPDTEDNISVPPDDEDNISVPPDDEDNISVPPDDEDNISVPPDDEDNISVPPDDEDNISVPPDDEDKISVPPDNDDTISPQNDVDHKPQAPDANKQTSDVVPPKN